jgi:hypothetical protein
VVEIWDLALDNNFDLIFAGNRDLSGVDGTTLLQQRVRTRLRIDRGMWIYDRSGQLGSRLRTLTRRTRPDALAEIEGMIYEALDDMDDIEVMDVVVNEDELAPRGISATVEFRPRIRQQEATLPLLEDTTRFQVTTTL